MFVRHQPNGANPNPLSQLLVQPRMVPNPQQIVLDVLSHSTYTHIYKLELLEESRSFEEAQNK